MSPAFNKLLGVFECLLIEKFGPEQESAPFELSQAFYKLKGLVEYITVERETPVEEYFLPESELEEV